MSNKNYEEKGNPDKEELYKEINNLKKIVEKTLFQVRLLLSEVENPFRYISKYLTGGEEEIKAKSKKKTIDEILSEQYSEEKKLLNEGKETSSKNVTSEEIRKGKEDKKSMEKKLFMKSEGNEEVELDDLKESGVVERYKKNNKDLNYQVNEKRDSYLIKFSNKSVDKFKLDLTNSRYLSNIYHRGLLATNLLVKLFGKNRVKKSLYNYLKTRLIDEEIYFMVLDALDKLDNSNSNGFLNDFKSEDHIIAIYILNQIRNLDPWVFYVFHILLDRISESIPLVKLLSKSNFSGD